MLTSDYYEVTGFNQNYQNGGFQVGVYDSLAEQPTTINWTRQSPYNGPKNLKEKWKVELPDTLIRFSPVIGSNGEIYVGSSSGKLYSISSEGRINWVCQLDGCLESPVIGADHLIFVGTRSGYLYAVDVQGNVKWKFESDSPITFSPSLDSNGTIYFVAGDTLYAVTSQGEPSWTYKSQYIFRSSVSIGADGTIYVEGIKSIFALEPDGTLKWESRIRGLSFSAPVIGSNQMLFDQFYIEDTSSLIALNCRTGEKIWSFKPQRGRICTSVALGDRNTLYVGTNIFEVYALTVDGEVLWQQKIEGFMYQPPLVSADGTIYVTTNLDVSSHMKSWVFAISKEGNILSSFSNIEGTTTSPAMGRNGTLYVISGFTDQDKLSVIALDGA